jgi:hypothetical protein
MTQAKFKINDIQYEFKDITLRTYYQILDIEKDKLTERQLEYKIVNILSDCPEKELKKLKFSDWLLVWEEAKYRLGSIHGNADTIKPVIELGGVKYSLPDTADMTIGEFADLEVIQASTDANRRLNEVAAVLYRPVKKTRGKKLVVEEYDSEGFEERKELFMDLPLWAIKSANSFFLQSVQQSLESTLESLKSMTKISSMSPEQKESLENLVGKLQDFGGTSFIDLQASMLLDLSQHQDSKYVRPLITLRGKWTKLKDSVLKHKRKIQSVFVKK